MMTRAPIPPSQLSGALDFLAVLRLIAQNPEEIQARLQELAEAQAEQAARADNLRHKASELEQKIAAATATIDEADAAMADLSAAREAAAADNEKALAAIKSAADEASAAEQKVLELRELQSLEVANFKAECAARVAGIDRREAELAESLAKHTKIIESELAEIASRRGAVAAAADAVAALRAEYEDKIQKIQGLASTLTGGTS